MAVGKTSLDDWPMLASSLGWTRRPSARGPPRISLARLASTSFMFMLLWVPLPVCQITRGNSSSCLPVATSSAAATIAFPFFSSRRASSMLTSAHAFLTRARARISPGGRRSPEILKCCSERWVCPPQRGSAGTLMGPNVSFSVRVSGTLVVIESPCNGSTIVDPATRAARSAAGGQAEAQALGVDARPGAVEACVFDADARDLPDECRSGEGHDPALTAEAREENRVEGLERFL